MSIQISPGHPAKGYSGITEASQIFLSLMQPDPVFWCQVSLSWSYMANLNSTNSSQELISLELPIMVGIIIANDLNVTYMISSIMGHSVLTDQDFKAKL